MQQAPPTSPACPSPEPLCSLRGISELPQAAAMCYLLHLCLPEWARFSLEPASVVPILNFFPPLVEKLNELL